MSRTNQSTVTNVTVDNANRLKEPAAKIGSSAGGPVHFVATTHSSGNNSYHGGIEIQKSVAVWRDGESEDVEVSHKSIISCIDADAQPIIYYCSSRQ